MPGTDRGPLLVIGASGRVGRLLARHWTVATLPQTRGPAPGADWLSWTPGEGPLPVPAGIPAMVVLARADPALGEEAEARLLSLCLDAAREAGIARVLYASSQAVYGPPGARPFREDDPLRPATPYGRGKALAEQACARARDAGRDVTALRIGNVAGADMLLTNAARATAESPLRLDRFADGAGPRRSYIGADTLARVIETLAHAPALPPALNVAAPGPVTMERLLQAAGVPYVFAPAPEDAVQDVTLDVGALERLVAFTPADSDPDRLALVLGEIA